MLLQWKSKLKQSSLWSLSWVDSGKEWAGGGGVCYHTHFSSMISWAPCWSVQAPDRPLPACAGTFLNSPAGWDGLLPDPFLLHVSGAWGRPLLLFLHPQHLPYAKFRGRGKEGNYIKAVTPARAYTNHLVSWGSSLQLEGGSAATMHCLGICPNSSCWSRAIAFLFEFFY